MQMGLVAYAVSYAYARYIRYVSDTQISFSAAYRLNSASSNNDAVFPVYVKGLKLP
jgi:hypothetical protein